MSSMTSSISQQMMCLSNHSKYVSISIPVLVLLVLQAKSAGDEWFDYDDDMSDLSVLHPVDKWLGAPVESNCTDPIGYWTLLKASKHPLAQMALDFLSAPGKPLSFILLIYLSISSFFN